MWVQISSKQVEDLVQVTPCRLKNYVATPAELTYPITTGSYLQYLSVSYCNSDGSELVVVSISLQNDMTTAKVQAG